MTVVLIGLSGAAWAQQTVPAGTTTSAAGIAAVTMPERLRSCSKSTTTDPFTGSGEGGMSADNLLGVNVVVSDGTSVGEVSDLIIRQADVVHHATVEGGGILGIGAETTARDLEHATVDHGKCGVTLDITRGQIERCSNTSVTTTAGSRAELEPRPDPTTGRALSSTSVHVV